MPDLESRVLRQTLKQAKQDYRKSHHNTNVRIEKRLERSHALSQRAAQLQKSEAQRLARAKERREREKVTREKERRQRVAEAERGKQFTGSTQHPRSQVRIDFLLPRNRAATIEDQCQPAIAEESGTEEESDIAESTTSVDENDEAEDGEFDTSFDFGLDVMADMINAQEDADAEGACSDEDEMTLTSIPGELPAVARLDSLEALLVSNSQISRELDDECTSEAETTNRVAQERGKVQQIDGNAEVRSGNATCRTNGDDTLPDQPVVQVSQQWLEKLVESDPPSSQFSSPSFMAENNTNKEMVTMTRNDVNEKRHDTTACMKTELHSSWELHCLMEQLDSTPPSSI